MKSKSTILLFVGSVILNGCANHMGSDGVTVPTPVRKSLSGIGATQGPTSYERPQLLEGKWLSPCYENTLAATADEAFARLEYDFEFESSALTETRHFYKDKDCATAGSSDSVRNGKFNVGSPVDDLHPEAANGARKINLTLENGTPELPSPDLNQTIFLVRASELYLGDPKSKPFDDRPSQFYMTLPFTRL